MSYVKKTRQNQNRLIALGLSILCCIIIGVLFDCYYDLNDDVMMKDIVSGVYTGVPSGFNIQMLFPLSFIISLFYRISANIPWYGLFLCGCHFLCLYLITDRILSFLNSLWIKLIVICVEVSLILSLLLYEVVFTQYTVTSAILAGTAAFLFFTSHNEDNLKSFFKINIPSIILVIIAFQIRSEMLLLVLPLICVTGVCKWANEKPVFTKLNASKYFSIFGAILLGLIISEGIHMLAYSSNGWQQFNEFFDYRTEVYDYYGIPPYEGNEDFYESIGLSKEEQILLENYNFGMDEEIDAELLEKVSNYSKQLRRTYISTIADLEEAKKTYQYRLFHETDYPFNLIVIVLYVLVFINAMVNKRFGYIWMLPFLAFVRTSLWMFIEYRRRTPPRITHSLYLMEILILFAMLLWEKRSNTKMKLVICIVCTCILGFLGISRLPRSYAEVYTEYQRRETVNCEYKALKDYVQVHKANFYFWDVYSSVAYSEKLFVDVSPGITNYDIMGGWACKSPLMNQKYAKFDIESMDEALLYKQNVFVIVKTNDLPKVVEWIPEYYKEKGIQVKLMKEDDIYNGENIVFTVYSIKPSLNIEVD